MSPTVEEIRKHQIEDDTVPVKDRDELAARCERMMQDRRDLLTMLDAKQAAHDAPFNQSIFDKDRFGDLIDTELKSILDASWVHLLNEDEKVSTRALMIFKLANELTNRRKSALSPVGAVVGRAARDVMAERQRQIGAEGWTPGHDDHEHFDGQLARAAAGYAMHASGRMDLTRAFVRGEKPTEATYVPRGWPWEASAWKPKDPRKDLVRAGALILAEIERLDRIDSGRVIAPDAGQPGAVSGAENAAGGVVGSADEGVGK